MKYVSRVPQPPLDQLVDDLYYLEGNPPYSRLKLPPMPSAVLAYPASTRSVGVHFKTWGWAPFIGIPGSEVCGRPLTAGQVWGRYGDQLRDRLDAASAPEKMLALLEEELRRRFMGVPGLGLVQHASGQIAAASGACRSAACAMKPVCEHYAPRPPAQADRRHHPKLSHVAVTAEQLEAAVDDPRACTSVQNSIEECVSASTRSPLRSAGGLSTYVSAEAACIYGSPCLISWLGANDH